MKKRNYSYFFSIPLILFYGHLMGYYMWYYNIGLNPAVRSVEITYGQVPIVFVVLNITAFIAYKITKNRFHSTLKVYCFCFVLMFGSLLMTFFYYVIISADYPSPRSRDFIGILRFFGNYLFEFPAETPAGVFDY